ncbi:Vault protein inter-alpha-trypsin domain [Pelomyxa schiedti]|nr:Vault protein inter-alpha-trypsin domain [Pelomyxa schiedti]
MSLLQQFQDITGSDRTTAELYLDIGGQSLEGALQMYFDQQAATPAVSAPPSGSGSADLPPASTASVSASSAPPPLPPLVTYGRPFSGVYVAPASRKAAPAQPGSAPASGGGEQAAVPALPFEALNVTANVVGVTADVEMRHLFVNREDKPIEAVYKFAQSEFSVYALEVTVGGRVISSVVREKQAATNQYDDAIASGHGAYLLEKETDPLQGEMLKMQIGNLPPGGSAEISLKYVTELQCDQGNLRFELPNTRCLPMAAEPSAENSASPTPNRGFTFTGEFNLGLPVTNVKSPLALSHTISEGVSVKFSAPQISELFWIEFELDKSVDPMFSLIEQDEQSSCVAMISLFPNVSTDEEPQCEFVFLIDRSGSMAGSRINQAKNALQLFLRSIPTGCLFNIIGFGTRFESLFPESRPYNDETFQTATQHVLDMKADLQGTDVLPPMKAILSSKANPNYPRQIFFLTDGEVKNTDEVISYVKTHAEGTRIFTFGISAEASPQLVRGVAAATRGKAEFVTSGVRLEPKVMGQIKRALQPILKNVEIDWGSVTADQVPKVLPPIFDGDRLLVYGFLSDTSNVGLSIGRVRGFLNDREITFPFQMRISEPKMGTTVHRLAARTKIHELEEAPENKPRVIELALKYQIVSKYTSFVCTEARTDGTQDAIQLRTVEYSAKASNETPIIPTTPHAMYYNSIDSVDTLSSLSSQSNMFEAAYAPAYRSRALFGAPTLGALPADTDSDSGSEEEDEEEPANMMRERQRGKTMASYSFESVSDDFADFAAAAELKPEAAEPSKPEQKQAKARRSSIESEEFSSNFQAYAMDKALNDEKKQKQEQPRPQISVHQEQMKKSEEFKPQALPHLMPGMMAPPASSFQSLGIGGLAGAVPAFLPAMAAQPYAQPYGYPPPPTPASAPPPPPPPSSLFGMFMGGMPQSMAAPPAQPTKPTLLTQALPSGSQVRPLDKFIFMQKSDGSWDFTEAAESILGITMQKIRDTVPTELSTAKNSLIIWSTAIALSALSILFADSTDEWEILATKGRKWLNARLTELHVELTVILTQAKALFPSRT